MCNRMRNVLVVLSVLLCSVTSAAAQVSVGIGFPGVSIGVNLPVYPQLVRVPNYPVYYAPQVSSNYFFYDGMYWVYEGDNWYASSWYNGPWGLVTAEAVPLFVLRVPVRYYRQPPAYFYGWLSDAPPRWGQHWGNSWEQNHRGWDNWNRSSVPQPAPLPAYQRQYSGNRYPAAAQQQVLVTQNYRYQPRDVVVRQHYQAQRVQSQPAPSQQGSLTASPQAQQPPQAAAQRRRQAPNAQGQDGQAQSKARPTEPKQVHAQPPPQPPQAAAQRQQQPPQPPQAAAQRQQQPSKAQGEDKQPQATAPAKEPKQVQGQQPPQAAVQRQQQAPGAQKEDKKPTASKEPKPSKEKDRDGDKGEQKGGDRSK